MPRVLLVAGLSLVAGLGVIVTAPWLADVSVGEGAATSLRWAGASIPGFALIGLLSELYKGVHRAWLGLLTQNVVTPVLVIALVLLTSDPDSAAASAFIFAASAAAALAALGHWMQLLGLFRGTRSAPTHSFSSSILSLVRDVPTLLVVTSAPVVMQWVGAALLGFLASPAQVAGYSVAARLAIAVSVVHSAASSVSAPRMAIAHGSRDDAGLEKVVHQTGILITLITLPILVVLAVGAPQFLGLFGPGLDQFTACLRILLVGQVVASLIGHSGMVLVMAGHYTAARITSFVALGSLIASMGLLVPPWGARGAALATSTAVVLGHLAGLILVRRLLQIWTVPFLPNAGFRER